MESAGALPHMSFGQAVVLFPLAVSLHVLEEWPGFPRWARRFASEKYSDREYIVTHILAIVLAVGSVVLIRAFPNNWMLFGFWAFMFGPGIVCNALFHAGATALTRTYCPGVITSLLVYVPLSALLVFLALREGLFTGTLLMAALAVAGILHAIEVGHNVFKRW